MKILDRHIRKTILGSIFLVLLVLIGLFSFFEFVEELNDLGQGSYRLIDAIKYVLLKIPSLTYTLFPLAGLIGSLVGLGTLMSQNEIVVMRNAGISFQRIVLSIMKAGAVIIVIAMILGEFIVPVTEQYANYIRSVAINDQISLKTRNGLWVREGKSYLNVRTILPGNIIKDIYIYNFDDDNRLITSSHAETAAYRDDKWQLKNVTQTHISENLVTRDTEVDTNWDSLLRPELISLVSIKPENLSVFDLVNYTSYLKENNRNSQTYRQAFWSKIIYPLSTGVMIFLAIPIVLGASQNQNIGQRIFIGIVIGLIFHIINQGMGNVGIVYKLPPLLAVATPVFITLIIGFFLMRRLVTN
ncbi:MAG: LPS export ABC transporter permease LptG [Gammaproteobacteria bacterium]